MFRHFAAFVRMVSCHFFRAWRKPATKRKTREATVEVKPVEQTQSKKRTTKLVLDDIKSQRERR